MTEKKAMRCPKYTAVMFSGLLSIQGALGWEINWRLKKRKLGEKVAAFRVWSVDM
ncbi:MAG: hypothetical protein ACLFU9_05815 [Candidatus Bathyarchaeia archaeon]